MSCVFIIELLYHWQEGVVVVFAVAELAIDEHHEFHVAMEAQLVVGLTVDVVSEDVAQPLPFAR